MPLTIIKVPMVDTLLGRPLGFEADGTGTAGGDEGSNDIANSFHAFSVERPIFSLLSGHLGRAGTNPKKRRAAEWLPFSAVQKYYAAGAAA
jgi:hypothetical protein